MQWKIYYFFSKILHENLNNKLKKLAECSEVSRTTFCVDVYLMHMEGRYEVCNLVYAVQRSYIRSLMQ